MALVEKMTLTFMETPLNETMSNAWWEWLAGAGAEAAGPEPRRWSLWNTVF